jgi:deazaflavin-dependent oxidoreductase (nitroreductase family)
MSTITHERRRRPLLGVRRGPGRIALWFMRLPRPLYHHRLGRLLGHTFVLIAHEGRNTGKRHETVAMAMAYDPATREVIVCSAWGANSEWVRNLRARPALEIRIGRDSFVPAHRFLSDDEGATVAIAFRRRHPWRVRVIARILGWGDLRSEPAMRSFVHSRPFIAFQPGVFDATE